MLEILTFNHGVVGSKPTGLTNKIKGLYAIRKRQRGDRYDIGTGLQRIGRPASRKISRPTIMRHNPKSSRGFPVCGVGATLTSDLAFAGGIALTVSDLGRTMQRFELAMRGHRPNV
jgi:hypothetical protein